MPSGTREKGGLDNLPSSVLSLGTQLSALHSFFILLQPRALAATDAGSCVTDLVTMAYHEYANTTRMQVSAELARIIVLDAAAA